MYDFENKLEGPQAEIANHVVIAIARLLSAASGPMEEPGAKISMLVGSCIPPFSALAVVFAKDHDKCLQTTTEETTFGALYTIASLENHKQGLIAGFSLNTLRKALVMFKEMTGRDYTNISPVLVKLMEEQEAGAKDVPVHLKKFVS